MILYEIIDGFEVYVTCRNEIYIKKEGYKTRMLTPILIQNLREGVTIKDIILLEIKVMKDE